MCAYKILNGGTTTKCSRIPWKTSLICFYLLLALMKISSCEAMPSIKEFFFPTLGNNLIRMTWAHDVYNDASFQEALNDKSMMIVGDVTMAVRGLSSKKTYTLYMKDSYNKRGMDLNTFLQKAADAKSVAVKLNFDDIRDFEESIKVLQAMSGKIKFPLWLNADTYKMEDKDIDKFLSLCTHNFPKATISIVMFHNGKRLGSEIGYIAKLVNQMKEALTRNNVTQTVAFPVRINEEADSLDTLQALKDVHGITDSAIYMYGLLQGDFKGKPNPNLKKFIEDFGKDRVYLDGPEWVVKKYI
uniref:Menorin-like domain-containing protein n=1 Tax=Timema cristinae TaxID=61476 RepID=A0A7R9D0Y1_TIMCR|nr:unnamed protein product [Timema cristinae]